MYEFLSLVLNVDDDDIFEEILAESSQNSTSVQDYFLQNKSNLLAVGNNINFTDFET